MHYCENDYQFAGLKAPEGIPIRLDYGFFSNSKDQSEKISKKLETRPIEGYIGRALTKRKNSEKHCSVAKKPYFPAFFRKLLSVPLDPNINKVVTFKTLKTVFKKKTSKNQNMCEKKYSKNVLKSKHFSLKKIFKTLQSGGNPSKALYARKRLFLLKV